MNVSLNRIIFAWVLSQWENKSEIPALLGNYVRQTNRPTDRPTDRLIDRLLGKFPSNQKREDLLKESYGELWGKVKWGFTFAHNHLLNYVSIKKLLSFIFDCFLLLLPVCCRCDRRADDAVMKRAAGGMGQRDFVF